MAEPRRARPLRRRETSRNPVILRLSARRACAKLARLLLGSWAYIGERIMTTTTMAPAARKPLYTSLFVQVLAGLILGIILGVAWPDFAVSLKILSDAFL